MSPLYDNDGTSEVLFEQDGFQVSQYSGMDNIQLVHRCPMKTENVGKASGYSDDTAEFVSQSVITGAWRCDYCYLKCPDDVVTVWTMMEGNKSLNKYYSRVKFSGLAEAVSE